ncbi:MAG: hypothetical protein KF830_07930 [Planctomycetes bacterium]|nr:hypothetical protein [Planctomycetota bacterium]
MTGESARDDHDDFLDDDFVIEDIAPKNEDLDRLFELPPGLAGAAAPAAAPDADDLLFTAPPADQPASETFAGRTQFADGAASDWNGDELELEAPVADEAAPAAEPANPAQLPAEALAAAEASFAEELGAMLQADEELTLDSEQELEVIGEGDTADGISEFEQSGPFVLDDGEGLWREEGAPAAAEAEFAAVPVADEATSEPGWEPLPAATVDELAEVEEVARMPDEAADDADAADPDAAFAAGETADEAADEATDEAPELVGVGVAAEAEGHDLYIDEPEVQGVRGGRQPRRRGGLVLAFAGTLTAVAAAATVLLRPEWVGLHVPPERLTVAEVPRPQVAVVVPPPPAVVDPAAAEAAAGIAPATTEPTTIEPPAPAVVVAEPPPVPPREPDVAPAATAPVAVVDAPTGEPATDVLPTPPAPTPVVVQAPDLPAWPVPSAAAAPTTVAQDGTPPRPARLVRVSDELMIGDPEAIGRPRAHGVVPGSRAFAQLQNGNYFIGNVKSADDERITLRLDKGEVTIPVAAIARLTELGSADYEDLQKVTSGFVRLTNKNRLVGGILSGIADDHVVLEFRKNRVMLPKALVGQVVQGEGDAGVRLDTTREEDDWLRRLVERQLGTGEPPPAAPPEARSPR